MWNYRLVQKKYPSGSVSKSDLLLEIREVYYNPDGTIYGIRESASTVWGETQEEILQTLKWMQEALTKPVIDWHTLEEVEQK